MYQPHRDGISNGAKYHPAPSERHAIQAPKGRDPQGMSEALALGMTKNPFALKGRHPLSKGYALAYVETHAIQAPSGRHPVSKGTALA